ncbi:MAG: hypothetical protein M3466_06090 [Gemmatimonadota bacterium]|nr:hypothetical protein [Gemmatimonadota bacterium]
MRLVWLRIQKGRVLGNNIERDLLALRESFHHHVVVRYGLFQRRDGLLVAGERTLMPPCRNTVGKLGKPANSPSLGTCGNLHRCGELASSGNPLCRTHLPGGLFDAGVLSRGD